ncbi:MAG: hypothetical protein M1830_005738 [Pleopsidium flavum]|nr:MAG: hypothetical protein M1830_005738 [Pleopsidium flavum]
MSSPLEPAPVEIPGGYIRPHAKYPPTLKSMMRLGTITDYGQRQYSRQGGRSSMFGGHAYYFFSDASCEDSGDPAVSAQSNSVAIVMDPTSPLVSAYLSVQHSGTVDPLVQLTDEERHLEAESDVKVMVRAPGGMVETSPGVGWVFWEKEEQERGDRRHCGVGVAMVNADESTGELEAYRGGGELLFGAEEPRVGSFCSIIEDDFIYSWGHYGIDVLLARVPARKPWDRGSYTFWNGEVYVEEWRAATPVLKDVMHGAVIKSGLFGAGREWVVVGCTQWADGQVMMGGAATLEGPWDLKKVCAVGGVDWIYPHQWVFDEARGELMVSWNEGKPAVVVAGRLRLEMGEPTYWKEVSINHCSLAIRQHLSPGGPEVATICARCAVNITTEGRWVMPGFAAPEDVVPLHLRVEGINQESVDEAAVLLRWKIEMKMADERRTADTAEGTRRRRSSLARALDRILH